jgi:hypothetical protein
MSLNKQKLQNVRDLDGGGLKARCPACAEAGQDRKGEHLRISADGKFGCCVFQGDSQHRKRIFALAGEHAPKEIRVRVSAPKTIQSVQLDLLGRLGQVFSNPTDGQDKTAQEVGTSGTGDQKSCACSNDEPESDRYIHKLIGSEQPVPSVPVEKAVQSRAESETAVPTVPVLPGRGNAPAELPHLLSDGTLRIPFNSPERYHWWKAGGQSLRETLAELRQPSSVNNPPSSEETNY